MDRSAAMAAMEWPWSVEKPARARPAWPLEVARQCHGEGAIVLCGLV